MTIALIVLVILIVLYFLGNKSVHHEIIINTTPEKVWSVLIDTDKYEEWNPVMKLLEGELIEGNKVKYKFAQSFDSQYDINASVKKYSSINCSVKVVVCL